MIFKKITLDEDKRNVEKSSPQAGFEPTIIALVVPDALSTRPLSQLISKASPLKYLSCLQYFRSTFGTLGGLRRSWDQVLFLP